jgi:predicted acetyltransferase
VGDLSPQTEVLPAPNRPSTRLCAGHVPGRGRYGYARGRVSIRHELNEFLTNFGGHIGYGVRPAYRRRGYASEILTQALIIARAEGIDRVLITCDQQNTASAKIIEAHGGVLEDVRPDPAGPPKRRYWIE